MEWYTHMMRRRVTRYRFRFRTAFRLLLQTTDRSAKIRGKSRKEDPLDDPTAHTRSSQDDERPGDGVEYVSSRAHASPFILHVWLLLCYSY